jgi:hypothetical protein
MDISRFITFEPKSDDFDDVDELAQQKLAESLQFKLRTHVDPGIDLRAARRAQTIRTRAENGAIIIDEDDSIKLFSGGMSLQEDRKTQAVNVDDLFRPSSGIPEIQETQSGSQMIFRSISLQTMFGQQFDSSQDEAVERLISNTLRNEAIPAIQEAIAESKRKAGK